MTGVLLQVDDLAVEFDTPKGPLRAVRGVSFQVGEGETLAIVGESGSGKSVTAHTLMGLVPLRARIVSGRVTIEGRDVTGLSDKEWRELRGERIAMIFQDPLSALNPSLTVGYQIAEMFRRHRRLGRKESRRLAVGLMEQVGIPDAERRLDDHPHRFSGGMRQRVMIAIALALDPRLLIADEPTTALDVTVQAQILRLLRQRQRADRLGMIIISHDLGVVARAADRVAVMYAGRIVETGTVAEVYERPAHPYTLGLMRAVPTPRDGGAPLEAIDGQPPDLLAPPDGCAFHPRCPFARDKCREVDPEQHELGPRRASACHFAEEVMTGVHTGHG
ncbi:ABC transporter ATP-binding protein [Nonomuraea glycinis]|jgi:oligopeptide transport system ATP-binding protein|uniref:ABC transporter ATP-binding protein n=1 Tax=Nonomuraea glycinis TaxID=2047744 RepID=A0A918E4D1_9ACTN|nr:ABC transporter ATP-binding protein [Nonomuraea glycinis]MCA2180388.1 ABC transporter ATP-binding protein [Nonomuraea glycinis]WSG69910.1 ABC transporter ATP-binding protein [Nonomuraea glycinis]GGP04125.1 ABC transporter ATP-binding protein [Nonomuraea glycinis]